MTEAETLLALWNRALETGDATAWADGAVFAPYDRLEIVTGGPAIAALLAARQRSAAAWQVRATWPTAEGLVLVAAQTLRLAFPDGSPDETRRQTLFLAATRATGGWRLVQVAEAMPAMILDVIAGYRADAA